MRAIACAITALAVVAAACSDDDDTFDDQTTQSERTVSVTEIVSNEPGAEETDTSLVNAWGLSFNPAGAAWVSSAENGTSQVYDASGNTLLPAVVIPSPEADEESDPTGQVFNDDPESFEGDVFVFVTEDGLVSGWQQVMGGEAVRRVDNSLTGAVYKGVTIADASGERRLYAADFRGAKIDVFDAAYAPVALTNAFEDPDIPDGFAPFNVKEVNGALIVTYARQDDDREDDEPGRGNGFVNVFDTEGAFIAHLISRGELNSPWGVALAPPEFDAAPDKLLIGNFGDGLIHVYDFVMSDVSASATLEGPLRDSSGDTIRIDGLWALEFPPGDVGGFSASDLYYTAGPNDEEGGVFGRIETTTRR